MQISFIKHPTLKADTGDLFNSPAVRFRRKFTLTEKARATLTVCGLGYGYYTINGKEVTKDLFAAPVSDYEKTLWYLRYDVTELLAAGENVFCAHLGNGFFNENFESAWGHDRAAWRDAPKLSVRLECGAFVLEGDALFKVSVDGALRYNQLRSGEYFDARAEENWQDLNFDDSAWESAAPDGAPPAGAFRLCECPPVRELAVFPCKRLIKTPEGFLFDFGQNFSGYARLRTCALRGTKITLRYAEEIDEHKRLKLNGLDIFYPSVPFQTDKFVSDGKARTWKPKFTYHGFRYVLLEGLREADENTLEGIFVGQAVEKTGSFSCSLPLLNQIYEAGVMSSRSNLCYALTDCPTREKLGWTNDAAASAEQLFLNFDILSFFEKWAQDMKDAMREDGGMPGIVPTCGWGYDLGPVTDAALFELPFTALQYCGAEEFARSMYPYCLRSLGYLDGRLWQERWFDLGDWTGARNKGDCVPAVQNLLMLSFLKKTIAMARELGEDARRLATMLMRYEQKICARYLVGGDYPKDEQTPLAMLLCNGLGDAEKLSAHLLRAVAAKDYHLDCGMIGTQYIYDALARSGAQDIALRMLSRPTPPSFAAWFKEGATTLYETFEGGKTQSKNHHMYSNILAWFFKYVLGIRAHGQGRAEIAPLKFADVQWAEGETRLYGKPLRVSVENRGEALFVEARVPQGLRVFAVGRELAAGTQTFQI